MERKYQKYIVHGKVQGVNYRRTLQKEVQRDLPNLKGSIENLKAHDCVEIIAFGLQKELKELLKICYKGSQYSDVDYIEFFDLEESSVNLDSSKGSFYIVF